MVIMCFIFYFPIEKNINYFTSATGTSVECVPIILYIDVSDCMQYCHRADSCNKKLIIQGNNTEKKFCTH